MNRTESITQLISVMGSIKRSFQGKTYRCQNGAKLTNGQLGLLFAIKHHGPISAQELASQLAMSPGGVSQLVDSLLDEGFVTRSVRAGDRRVFNLQLSALGSKQVSEIERERHTMLAESTKDLSDAELQQLVTSLQKILHAIQANKT